MTTTKRQRETPMPSALRDRREQQSGFKPRDVEEVVDFYFHRPLAAYLVRLLLPLPVTPDQVTIGSALVGLLSGAVIAVGIWRSPWWVAAGGLVLILSILLDCADGQLARIRGTSSPVGRILDGTMDVAAPLSVFHAFGFFLVSRGNDFALVWPLGFAAACSLVLHTSQYDGAKNLYLHCSRPDFSLGGKTLLSIDDIEAYRREFAAKRDWFRVLLMMIWRGWVRSQQKTFEAWNAELCPRTDEERAAYRELFFPYIRAWSWLGLGTHLCLLWLACFATPFYENAVWIAWIIMLVPLNLLHGWLVWRRPRLERAFLGRLRAMRQESAA